MSDLFDTVVKSHVLLVVPSSRIEGHAEHTEWVKQFLQQHGVQVNWSISLCAYWDFEEAKTNAAMLREQYADFPNVHFVLLGTAVFAAFGLNWTYTDYGLFCQAQPHEQHKFEKFNGFKPRGFRDKGAQLFQMLPFEAEKLQNTPNIPGSLKAFVEKL